MSKTAWMVRAGEGGFLYEDFAKNSLVSLGWLAPGKITDKSQRELRLRLGKVYPDSKAGRNQNTASVLWRFARVLKSGDAVVTYDPIKRSYLVGEIAGDYEFKAGRAHEHPHVRKVKWGGSVSRDLLDVATRNSLGTGRRGPILTPDKQVR